MSLPGFNAETTLGPLSGHYRSCDFALADFNAEEAVTPELRIGTGGRGRLGFSCGPFGCICSGDSDCNDMFTTNVCGPHAVCSVYGGQVVCICLR